MQEVIDAIHDKLIRRHPHVFADVVVKDSDEVLNNWDRIKEQELSEKKKARTSLLDGLPPGLPALYEAYQMGVRAARAGFDWESVDGVVDKVREELAELEEQLPTDNTPAIKEEIGDLLFSVVNLCRFLKIDPETSLKLTNQKFKQRFLYIEDKLKEKETRFQDCSMADLESIWQESKKWVN